METQDLVQDARRTLAAAIVSYGTARVQHRSWAPEFKAACDAVDVAIEAYRDALLAAR